MLSFVKNNWEKSKAAVLVQNLLEDHVSGGLCTLDPVATGTKLVSIVWDHKPDMFNGKFGQRPSSISVAAVALAAGLEKVGEGQNRTAVLVSLGSILDELSANGSLFPFNGLDVRLQTMAKNEYLRVADALGMLEDSALERSCS